MALNTQLDARPSEHLYLPFDSTTQELSEAPRLVAGENAWVTIGGKITKRPGLTSLSTEANATGNQNAWDIPDGYDYGPEGGPFGRTWYYRPVVYQEDQTATTNAFLVSSFRNTFTGLWSLWYINLTNSGEASSLLRWRSLPNGGGGHTDYRAINQSSYPHEGIVVESKLYVKSFPAYSVGEEIGAVVLDAGFLIVSRDYGFVDPWGIPGPTVPARIVCTKFQLNGAITSAATTLTVDSSTGAPATPFNVYIDYEEITVTNVTGTTWTVTRASGGTVAEAHDDNSPIFYRNWTATTYRTDVAWGWQYVYCYKSRTGQISNSSPLETDQTQKPSNTGPFYDKIPQITLQGHADTVLIPSIEVFRTSDAGGTFYHVETINNPGAGAFTYSDDSGTSGDPLPDSSLNQGFWAPDLHSNATPKANVRPDASGTYPDRCSKPAYFAGRIWYGIRNVLFFSNFEEQVEGVPLESFNDDPIFGNFLKFPHLIRYVIPTRTALLVVTEKQVLAITGSSRATFDFVTLHTNLGGHPNHPQAFVAVDDDAYFLTSESQIAKVSIGREPQFVSDAIAQNLIAAITGTDTIQMLHYRQGIADWVIVAKQSYSAPKQFILDLKLTALTQQPFWQAPWTAPMVGHVIDDSFKRWIGFTKTVLPGVSPDDGIWWCPVFIKASYGDNSAQPTVDQYRSPDLGGHTAIPFSFTTGLYRIPAGNHVNSMRKEGLSAALYAVKVERGGSVYTMGPTERRLQQQESPQITIYQDSLWVEGEQANTLSPPRRKHSEMYVTEWYPMNSTTERVAIKYELPESYGSVDIYGLSVVFNPDGGA